MKIFVCMFLMIINMAFGADTFMIRPLRENELKPIKDQVKTDLVAIVAYGNYCPIFKRHIPTLNEMAKTYDGQVSFIMLNSIKDVSDPELEVEKKELKLEPPIYQDKNLETVKALGLTTLSEVVLLKVSTGQVLYRGAINNQFTFDLLRQKPTENYLIDAITNDFNKEEVKVKKSKVFGCAISF